MAEQAAQPEHPHWQHWQHYRPLTPIITPSPAITPTYPHIHHRPHRHHGAREHEPTQGLGNLKTEFTVRPAEPTDLPACHSVFKYYVRNTTISLLLHEPDPSYLMDAYQSALERRLPFLVAESTITSPPLLLPKVLGYAYISPLSPKAGYSPSVELTIYLHPASLSSGIGSALLKAVESGLREQKAWVFEKGFEALGSEVRVDRLFVRMSGDLDGRGTKAGNDMVSSEAGDGGGDSEMRTDLDSSARLLEKRPNDNKDGLPRDHDASVPNEWPVWEPQGYKTREWYIRRGFEEAGRLTGAGNKFGVRTDVIILQKDLTPPIEVAP